MRKPATKTLQNGNEQNESKTNERTKKKNNQQSPHHSISYFKHRAKQIKASATKKAHDNKNNTAKKDNIKTQQNSNNTNLALT